MKSNNAALTYSAALEIQTQEEADEFFGRLMEAVMKESPNISREEAEKIQRSNLGYFAGYGDSETRERVERLFKCAHPVFGSIKENGAPTPEQAFQMGRSMGAILGIQKQLDAWEKGLK